MKFRKPILYLVIISFVFTFSFFPPSILAQTKNEGGRRIIRLDATPFPTTELSPSPSVSSSPTPSPDVSPSPSLQPSPSVDPTVTPSSVLIDTPTPSNTPSVTPTPSAPTPTPSPMSPTPTPVPPVIYPQSEVTVSPTPAVLGISQQTTPTPQLQITPTPTTAPLLQRTLPKLMELLNYGNKTEFYGQTGFTTQETRVLVSVALFLLLAGIYLFYYEKIISFFNYLQNKLSSMTNDRHLDHIVFPLHK